MLCKSEPTKSEKAKGVALAAAGLAAEKAVEAKVKAEKDIVPTLAEKAEEARDAIVEKVEGAREAAAPHVEAAAEKVADATADQREAVADKAGSAKAATVASLAAFAGSAADARKDAEKKGSKFAKKADKKTSRFAKQADKKSSKFAKKSQKKADKKAAALAALVAAKAASAEKKAVDTFGPSAREDVSYKAAALRGRAESIAEDKGLTADNARDFYKDELLPHLKEILATAAAAGTAASHNVVGQLPEGAQKQVAQYAPALAPKKKKGGLLITLGVAALAGAGYLVYADQQKKRAADARLSEASIADSAAARGDEMTINNPVTNFAQADDTTMVRPAGADADVTAEPAGGPGTAATWTDAEATGHMTTEGLEDPSAGETRSSRRAARDDH